MHRGMSADEVLHRIWVLQACFLAGLAAGGAAAAGAAGPAGLGDAATEFAVATVDEDRADVDVDA